MQTPQVVPVQRFSYVPKFQPPAFQKQNHVAFPAHRQHAQTANQAIEFDGKRLRKAVTRKTVDYNSAVIKHLEARVWQRDYRDRRAMQPDPAYYTEMTPPLSMPDNPINSVTTKFVRTSTNKMRCPIFCVAWTPEGRRLVTGASSGEFTLWNGLTFNFETILQAHDSPVRCMVWSHNDVWMVTGDHAGYVKYWQSNMNNVKMFQAHKEPLRGISFCPIDTKFVTCSDDGTVRIWDFLKCFEEKILRGHGADVKCVDWHPQKSLIVSGSKDSQQPIKLWDPKSGQSLATVHAHKNTVMDARWNKNGNWLLTASRDHLIKLFDIRNMSQEMQTFRGHKKEATTLAWHPTHEGLFSSGGSDGCIMFWVVGADKEVGCMEQAHDSCVWSLAWHPLGHILCSGSNDHSSKFWTRNRPGDRMRDKYNLNTLPKGQEDAADYDDSNTISSIPGMGLEYGLPDHLKQQDNSFEDEVMHIPGLDFTTEESATEKSTQQKKTPFAKPIPKQFQQQWMESKQPLLLAPPPESQERSNGQIQAAPEKKQRMPAPEQFHVNSRSENQYPEQVIQPPRPALLGERPIDQNQVPVLPQHESGLKPSNDMSYQENENFPHNMNAGTHDAWRSYSEHPTDMDVQHREMQDNMHRENGASIQNREMRPGFEPTNNINQPNRGRQERFPQPPSMGDEDFRSENVSRNGPPSHYGPDGRYPAGDVDLRNNHMGPGQDDMGYRGGHKHAWTDGPMREESYPQRMDYDGPPPSDFNNSRMHMRPPANQMFHNSRGNRGHYRGRSSPYRIVNRGRGGRGGFSS
ncbi:pre-mRNA 3' end processing protein WDR33-like [Uloborus diversus]|uniref:pre-mRNA 3' end processing protein WDR33-like n=1 Tax=Uloborus diversus TaxID=327109 RepID=UPI0024092CF3|nr:pre-mRNA 3' end processing protein WDR33-like [Uloborus diversus]